MFSKIFALFALLAVAFAAPNPKPEPSPQYLTYSAGVAGLDYVYQPAVVPSYGSPYAAAAYPVAYSAYPANTAYYLRK